MKVCEDMHDEIVYSGKNCPLCTAKSDIEDYETEVTELKEAIQDLQKDLDKSEEKIQSLVSVLEAKK